MKYKALHKSISTAYRDLSIRKRTPSNRLYFEANPQASMLVEQALMNLEAALKVIK